MIHRAQLKSTHALWTYDRANFWLFTDANPGVAFPKSPFRAHVWIVRP
jgi:hypothetical protein